MPQKYLYDFIHSHNQTKFSDCKNNAQTAKICFVLRLSMSQTLSTYLSHYYKPCLNQAAGKSLEYNRKRVVVT